MDARCDHYRCLLSCCAAGSAEGHTAYCYRHVFSHDLDINVTPQPDPLFMEALDMLHDKSLSDLRQWVHEKLKGQMTSPRPSRKCKAKGGGQEASTKLDFTGV